MQALALAAFLIPLGSVAVQTAPLQCGFGAYYGYNAYIGEGQGCAASSPTSNRYEWGDYYVLLTLDDPDGDFFITITDNQMTDAQFETRDGMFEDYQCIALTDGGPCIDFHVQPSVTENAWSHYTIEIHWNLWEGQPEYDSSLVRILHDIGDTGTNAYDEDMCVEAQEDDSYDPCVFDPDPGIRSGNTDFRSFTAALAPSQVPEPSTMILLGTGIATAVVRGRRRRPRSGGEAA